jgi:CheY-like chemotaxis protein
VKCEPPDRPCILVVDDDPDLTAFLFSVLVDEGFSIMPASHGQQALDLLEHGLRPHVILIDLLLPRVSGIECAHAHPR